MTILVYINILLRFLDIIILSVLLCDSSDDYDTESEIVTDGEDEDRLSSRQQKTRKILSHT